MPRTNKIHHRVVKFVAGKENRSVRKVYIGVGYFKGLFFSFSMKNKDISNFKLCMEKSSFGLAIDDKILNNIGRFLL